MDKAAFVTEASANHRERIMIIFSWIMLVGTVGLLWATVLSLIHTDGRDHNGHTASHIPNRTAESHSERAA
jgi:hypothetical protein